MAKQKRVTHFPGYGRIKREVFQRDNYTCRYCGCTGVKLHLEHVYPVSKGGNDEVANLVTACSGCNLQKSDKIGIWPKPLEYFQMVNYVADVTTLDDYAAPRMLAKQREMERAKKQLEEAVAQYALEIEDYERNIKDMARRHDIVLSDAKSEYTRKLQAIPHDWIETLFMIGCLLFVAPYSLRVFGGVYWSNLSLILTIAGMVMALSAAGIYFGWHRGRKYEAKRL